MHDHGRGARSAPGAREPRCVRLQPGGRRHAQQAAHPHPYQRPRAAVRVRRAVRQRQRAEGGRHARAAQRGAPRQLAAGCHRHGLGRRPAGRPARVAGAAHGAGARALRRAFLPRQGHADAGRVLPRARAQPRNTQDLAAAAGGFPPAVRVPRVPLRVGAVDLAVEPRQRQLQRSGQRGATHRGRAGPRARFSDSLSLGQGLVAIRAAELAMAGAHTTSMPSSAARARRARGSRPGR
jgi:hypothetical protein